MQAIHNNNNQYSSHGVTDALQRAWKSLPLLPCYCCLSSPPLFSLHLLPGMCLAQPMITTSSRSARSQRVVSVRWAVSGCIGSGMANNFSGSATRRWDTMMLEESVTKTHNKRCINYCIHSDMLIPTTSALSLSKQTHSDIFWWSPLLFTVLYAVQYINMDFKNRLRICQLCLLLMIIILCLYHSQIHVAWTIQVKLH